MTIDNFIHDIEKAILYGARTAEEYINKKVDERQEQAEKQLARIYNSIIDLLVRGGGGGSGGGFIRRGNRNASERNVRQITAQLRIEQQRNPENREIQKILQKLATTRRQQNYRKQLPNNP